MRLTCGGNCVGLAGGGTLLGPPGGGCSWRERFSMTFGEWVGEFAREGGPWWKVRMVAILDEVCE